MAPSNQAAFLTGRHVPLKVQASIYTSPGENEILVKNGAVAINPYDWAVQGTPGLLVPWVKLPFILGSDIAGEVVEVGKGVTRFKKGDRVVAHAAASVKTVNRASEGGFQEYTIVRNNLTSTIPPWMTYEVASVMPLGLSTAACALFQKDFLALPFPTTSPTPSGKTLLIWGGSTSVGCNAIQLAVAAGYEVISTASPKNHAYLKSLGATEVYDYRSKTVVADIVSVFKSRNSAGAVSIGQGSFKKCIEILGSVKGNRFISMVSFHVPPDTLPKGTLDFPPLMAKVAYQMLSGNLKARVNGVTSKFVNGSTLMGNEVGKAIYEDFLPRALAEGKFVASPEPHVVGKGLKHVQEAMYLNKKGVSSKKLVVSL
jgi:NADPH:quinone reductase-like Zn-dependent oxidoreductase